MNIESAQIDPKLIQIAQEEGCKTTDLARILGMLPVKDESDITYLEAAGQCILEVSSLVDNLSIDISSNQRTAHKLRLMGKLLQLKAEQLV